MSNKPSIEPWKPPTETPPDLDWAPLTTIDLSRFDLPGGKQSLAEELKSAVRTWGFWTVINSGIPQDLVDRQFSIANAFFNRPVEEKRQVVVNYEGGSQHGYREPKPLKVPGTDQQVKQNVEMLNIPKIPPLGASESYPFSEPLHDMIDDFRDEIAEFQRLCYDKVLRRLLIIFALILELPETYFIERHEFSKPAEDQLRMLKYSRRSLEDDDKVKATWLAGHTDFGTLTLLFSQPIAALQILAPTNEWKWVKPIKGGITCNAADVLSFLTKGYIKSCIHRVVRPPLSQAHLDRIGIIYFLRPGNDVPITPVPSPVLVREGLIKEEDQSLNEESGAAVTGYEYVRARVAHFNTRKDWRLDEKNSKQMFQVKGLSVQDFYV